MLPEALDLGAPVETERAPSDVRPRKTRGGHKKPAA
jgi:hypothetical protein